jgi:hypothetical protein
MTVDFEQQWTAWGDESDDEDDVEDDEPPGGHLRFLNSYHRRAYEMDSLRGKRHPVARPAVV